MKARHHALQRTNPLGDPFVGECTLCGEQGLTSRDVNKPCENPLRVTEEDALLAAIERAERPGEG